MKRIAIIPARAGSKGLKDKNIIDLCGKPLMAYSIKAAQDTNLFEKIIVTTDSKQYGRIAESFGAQVLYRNKCLSGDSTSMYVVLADALERAGEPFDYFVLLQPTSPMRTSLHIKEAVQLFEDNLEKFDFLVSVKEAEHGQILVRPIDDDGSLKYFDEDYANYKRQSYIDYSPNGAIFIGKKQAYIYQKHFFGAKSLAYKMSKIDSIDIDDTVDYELACVCMRKRLETESR